MIIEKFKKVIVLDTVVFYPEHEEVLKLLVDRPKIERIPLTWDETKKEWVLPQGYILPEDANIIIWPSSLPESFEGLTLELHERLKTSQCWTEAGLKESISAQNLLNRVKDADCIITCWTNIPNEVLELINPKAIITWTHEFEHRLNTKRAIEKGIYVNSVQDYGTDAVAELEIDMLLKLIERNKGTTQKATSEEDITIGSLRRLFDFYRKSYINEKDTRRGSFSHQFHKLGRSQEYYGNFGEKELEQIMPQHLLQNKRIGILALNLPYLEKVLSDGFKMQINKFTNNNFNSAEFYKLLAENEFIIYDSTKTDEITKDKINLIKGKNIIDIQTLNHYEEILSGKTIGIVGLGRIGTRLAEISESLGIVVKYAGPIKNTLYEYADLKGLMKNCDIISINVKAHKAEGLISEEFIKLMKKGAYFINTSDGNAIDQKALTERMLNNEIFVGLDVYQGLPTTKTLFLDNDFKGKVKKQLSNHVLTYRVGWLTQESVRVKTYKLLGHMINCLANKEVK